MRSDNIQLKSDLNKCLSNLLATETKVLKKKNLKADIRVLQIELAELKQVAEDAKTREVLNRQNEEKVSLL